MSFCFLYNVVSENYSVQNSPLGGGGSIVSSRSIGYDYTSNKFAFQHDGVKVKVAVTVFRKTLQLKACQASKGKKSY